MKKILIVFSLLLCLVGCATEESPEYYFDVALSEVENLEEYTTHVHLETKDGQQIVHCEVTKYDGKLTYHYHLGPIFEEMEELATFTYANQFGDFRLEENTISCSIPKDEDNAITHTIRHFTFDEIENIDHHMILDNNSLNSCVIDVTTSHQIYTITITIEKAEA